MLRRSLLSMAVVSALTLPVMAGCSPQESDSRNNNETKVAETVENQQSTAKMFRELSDNYFKENLALNPFAAPVYGVDEYNDRFGDYLSDDYLKAQKKLENSYLHKVHSLDREALPVSDQIAYDQFVYDRQMALKGLDLPSYYLPFNQFYSIANDFAEYGSGDYIQPFNTVKDYENWLKKADGFSTWVDHAIARMKEGQEKQIVLPQILVDMMIPQLQSQLVEKTQDSIFWGPINQLPDSFSKSDRDKLTAAYKKSIEETIIPAYRRMAEFLQNNYQGRNTTAMKDLPGGDNWYQYLADLNTTTTMSAEEIHNIGLAEVERIRGEMEKVREQVGFDGNLHEFFTYLNGDEFYWDNPEELINDYLAFQAKVDKVLPNYFNRFPKAPYEVRAVPANKEKTAGVGYYVEPSPDGDRPGIFFVNTARDNQLQKWNLETLFLHEAAPGHHFQIAIAQELEDIPMFQRFAGYTAYQEGWAVYVESIGKKMGLETDPLQYFGKLNEEMLRAMRLVVDTGLHHYGWTVEQAEQFMQDNSALGKGDVKAEVRRYLAIPGQALSYKVGQLTISRLSDKASQELGDKFDIRYFHDQILDSGSLPMTILEAKIDHWIEAQKESA